MATLLQVAPTQKTLPAYSGADAQVVYTLSNATVDAVVLFHASARGMAKRAHTRAYAQQVHGTAVSEPPFGWGGLRPVLAKESWHLGCGYVVQDVPVAATREALPGTNAVADASTSADARSDTTHTAAATAAATHVRTNARAGTIVGLAGPHYTIPVATTTASAAGGTLGYEAVRRALYICRKQGAVRRPQRQT